MIVPKLIGPHLDLEPQLLRLKLIPRRSGAEIYLPIGYGLEHVGIFLVFQKPDHAGIVLVTDDNVIAVGKRVTRIIEDALEHDVRGAASGQADALALEALKARICHLGLAVDGGLSDDHVTTKDF